MNSVAEESALIYAHAAMKAKDEEIDYLKERIHELNQQLDHEMGVCDALNDLNIQIKTKNSSLRERLKVIVLPTSLQKLTALVQSQEKSLSRLKRVLGGALDLIPDTPENKEKRQAIQDYFQDNA